jgi:hypothetical protein
VSESKALAIVPRTFDEVTTIAEKIAGSSLLPKGMQGKVPDVLVTIMAGQEMGFSPMASLRAFHVIEGKPVLSADGMVALALGSGKCVYFDRVEESDTAVTYETLRTGSKVPRRCTWTWDMAKRAALHLKDNWRLYPRAMLASRAKAELARDVYPDVLAGCYTEEELEGRQSADALRVERHPVARPDVIDAEVVSETKERLTLHPTSDHNGKGPCRDCRSEFERDELPGIKAQVQAANDPPEFKLIDNAESEEQLQAIVKHLQHLKGDARKRAKERFDGRREWLKRLAEKQAEVTPANDAKSEADEHGDTIAPMIVEGATA